MLISHGVPHPTIHRHAFIKHLLYAQICSRLLCWRGKGQSVGRIAEGRDVVIRAGFGTGRPGFKVRLHC